MRCMSMNAVTWSLDTGQMQSETPGDMKKAFHRRAFPSLTPRRKHQHRQPHCCRYIASVVSNSLRPHRRQPTRLPGPWDSPGKNTGVGCHFLLQCMRVKSEREVAQSYPTLSDRMDCSPPGSSVHGIVQARALEGAPLPSPHQRTATPKKSFS